MRNREVEKGGRSIQRVLLLLSCSLLALNFVQDTPFLIERLIVVFASSVVTVYLVAPVVIRISRLAGAVDLPGGRKIHTQPTPRWGGIAVYAGVVISLLLTTVTTMPNIQALLTSTTLVLIVGMLDDVFGVSAAIRLLVQLAGCILLIMDGVCVTFLPNTPWGICGEWLITIVWILGITNAINFLDGMDGLVPGLVAGTSLIYFVLSLLLGSNIMAYCSVALFAASMCFLGFNFKPARIFLGDGGSNFLGFFLAALSIQGGWARNDPLVSFFIPVLILSVPIYDMVFTTVARIWSGKVTSVKSWIEYTGRDHLHHRLAALGLSNAQVVATTWFLNMGIGLGAITLFEARTYGGIALILQAICVYLVLALMEVLGGRRLARRAAPDRAA